MQPVCIEFKNRLDTIRWTWEGRSAAKLILYTLCQFNNKMEITVSVFKFLKKKLYSDNKEVVILNTNLKYLPVYQPNEEEKRNANLFARNVRSKMAK